MTLQAHAEALYAGIRSLLGHHDASLVQAQLERELRHVVPTWKQSPPDCPGWYWFKSQGVSEPQLFSSVMGVLIPNSWPIWVRRITWWMSN